MHGRVVDFDLGEDVVEGKLVIPELIGDVGADDMLVAGEVDDDGVGGVDVETSG
jgi:hypothetical protein